MNPDTYNAREFKAGRIRPAHITALTELAQEDLGLNPDGKLGPETREELEAGGHDDARDLLAPLWRLVGLTRRAAGLEELLEIDPKGWLHGKHVRRVPAHESWYYAHRALATESGLPEAAVYHYTSTGPGTARVMAKRRQKPSGKRPKWMGLSSWHVTIARDGLLWQLVPFVCGAWHAGGPTAGDVPGLDLPANFSAVGIELEGKGRKFTEKQVAAACRLAAALARTYPIEREHAMHTHQEIDPRRRSDPGELWLSQHAPRVLAAAYGAV